MTGAAFYEEWSGHRPGERRDLRRAALLAARLGVTAPAAPVLTVVGSKGKGTAATYASAWLAAAGCRVVTVTSPALRDDTERIRLGGVAIGADELAGLGRLIREAMRSLPPRQDGYLAPSGLFTMAGLLFARAAAADVIVLEAGMGGASDEVSLVPAAVVAITTVFGEHLGVLGDTPAEIAADKAGVATRATSAVVSLPQTPDVTAAIETTVAARAGRAVETVEEDPPRAVAGPLTEIAHGAGVDPHAPGLRAGPFPSGLGRPNAVLGCVAAQRLLDATGRAAPHRDRAAAVLSSVRLPGRTSWHTIPGATLLVDSAVERTGAAAALAEAYRRWDRVDHVLVCLPDHKDLDGVLSALGGLPVTLVRMADRTSLGFTRSPGAVDAGELTRERLAGFGERLVVLGTVYFTGRILDLVGADTRRLFET